MITIVRSARASIVVSMLALALLAAFACGGDEANSEDEAAVEAAVRASNAAFNAQDFDTWFTYSTAESLAESFPAVTDRSEEGYRSAFEATAGQQYEITEVSDIDVDGDTATVTVAAAFSYPGSDPDTRLISASKGSMRRENGVWKFAGDSEWTSPNVPDGVKVVHVTADEYSWEFDAADFADGNIAIEVENIGEVQHMMDLRRVPDGLDLVAWTEGETSQEGIESVTGTAPIEAGETRALTFTGPFKPGRYFMTCFIEDLESAPGTFHLDLGMYAEFRVE